MFRLNEAVSPLSSARPFSVCPHSFCPGVPNRTQHCQHTFVSAEPKEELLTIWLILGVARAKAAPWLIFISTTPHDRLSIQLVVHHYPLPQSCFPVSPEPAHNMLGYSCPWCRTLHLCLWAPGGSCLTTAPAPHRPSAWQICPPVHQCFLLIINSLRI